MRIYYKKKIFEVKKNSTLESLCKDDSYFEDAGYAMFGIVNNNPYPLNYVLEDGDKVDIVTLKQTDGQKAYKRSLSFLFVYVMSKLYPSAVVEISHTISRGEFCEVTGIDRLTEKDIRNIKDYMNLLIHENILFVKNEVSVDDMGVLIKNNEEKTKLYKSLGQKTATIYSLNGFYDSFGGLLVPSTGYLKKFDVLLEEDGVVLLCPQKKNPELIENHLSQPKLVGVFNEIKDWAEIHGIHYLGDLNDKVKNNDYSDIIKVSEALHEFTISNIAEKAIEKKANLIFIAGPSSSGKTTFANRLRIQLMVHHYKPTIISMDDYFVDRATMVKDENGKYDFEDISAVNLELFKEQMTQLIKGEEIQLRRFDFKTGAGYFEEKTTKLNHGSQIIVEGIHGFNPVVIKLFEDYNTFKVCINPISQINLDKHNRISSTDCRKIRRMVRDYKHRNINAVKTITMWPDIRKGEEKNIFPYLESADAIFNSTLVYEMCILKKYAEKTLLEIGTDSEAYIEAKRLLNILSFFNLLTDEKDIPNTSILKEFIQ